MEQITKANIEIPQGSNIKYEYDRMTGKIVVDRILREGFTYPANYGYIDKTLDGDGDELDVLVFSPEKFLPGCTLNVLIIGAMKMIDDGETDTKLIGVHADDYRLNKYKTLEDLPQKWLKEVETFFTTYKNGKRPGITSVSGFEDHNYANNELKTCEKLYEEYKDGSKKDFINEMKTKHPDKYPSK